jgi:hypothetical protein
MGGTNTRIIDYICASIDGMFAIDYSVDFKSDHRLLWSKFAGYNSYGKNVCVLLWHESRRSVNLALS